MNMSDMTKTISRYGNALCTWVQSRQRGEDCKEARRRGKCIGQFGGGYFGGDL